MKIVVMGVAGCGKSTLGGRLARRLGCSMVEGDDFHLPASHEKMRSGIALDNADRVPWLAQLGAQMALERGGVVLCCSALKRRYRDRLRSFVADLKFVYVEIDLQSAAQRVASRSGHLFPKSLVTSQFSALESPVGEPGVLRVSALLPPEVQVQSVMQWLWISEETHTRSLA